MSDGKSNRKLTRRKVLKSAGAGGVVATTGLAGCMGNDGSDGNDGGKSETIEITGVWSDAEEKDFLKVTDHVESESELSIEYHPRTTDSLLTGTLMDYESGVAPADVVVMPFPARINSDAKNGHLASVGDAWKPKNFAVEPSRVTVDGEVYAVPFKMDLKPGFWYRKSFFEEHDLSEPKSYDDFLSLLDTISGIEGVDAPIASGNGTGWPLSDITEGFFMRQKNGAQLQQDLISGDARFTDERVKTAFQELQSLHQKGYFSKTRNFSVQYEYFWKNSLPLYFMGSFTPAQKAVKDPSDLGVFRLPGAKGISSSVNWLTVPKYSEKTDAARKAVELIASKEGQQAWVEQGGFIASNTKVPDDAYQIEVMSKLPDMANEVTVVPDLDDALGNPFQEEFWAQLKGFWSTPDKNIGDIVSALDSAHQKTLDK